MGAGLRRAYAAAKLTRARFGVFRVYDDGRKELVTPVGSHAEAAEAAGSMRDEMTDAECGADWNYQPGKM